LPDAAQIFIQQSPSTRISRSARILKHSTFRWCSVVFGGGFNLMHDAARPNRQMFISLKLQTYIHTYIHTNIYRTVWGHHQATI